MHWLEPFCLELACAGGFRRRAEAALRRQFEEATGLQLKKFILAPPVNGEADIGFADDGSARLDAHLIGPDGQSLPVSIVWRAAGIDRLLPSDPRADSAGDTLEVGWLALPAEALREAYSGPYGPPWPVSDSFPFDPANYSFGIDWEPFPWPDLWLDVETDRPATAASVDALIRALEPARERWNEAAEAGRAGAFIHNLGTQAEVTGPRSAVINIDFGSAPPKALIEMLDAMEQVAGKLGICRILWHGPA